MSHSHRQADMIVFTGSNVLLPGQAAPQPATITASTSTGKITQIQLGQTTRDDNVSEGVQWIDAGNKFILPGLVE